MNILARAIGTMIGAALKEAGPDFLLGVIRAALTSTGETGKKNTDFQRAIDAADDPLGLFRNSNHSNRAGNGGQDEQAHSD